MTGNGCGIRGAKADDGKNDMVMLFIYHLEIKISISLEKSQRYVEERTRKLSAYFAPVIDEQLKSTLSALKLVRNLKHPWYCTAWTRA